VHPAGGGVPGWRAEHDPETRDSGQAARCRHLCPSKTVSCPPTRRLPRVFPDFCPPHTDFPLPPWIEMLIRTKGESWVPLAQYKPKYQHRYWRKDGEVARQSGGHEGIDFFCIYDFVEMVRSGKKPWIDAYDAASWSSLIHCTRLSLDRAGARVEMPDFTRGRWKDPQWRQSQQI